MRNDQKRTKECEVWGRVMGKRESAVPFGILRLTLTERGSTISSLSSYGRLARFIRASRSPIRLYRMPFAGMCLPEGLTADFSCGDS